MKIRPSTTIVLSYLRRHVTAEHRPSMEDVAAGCELAARTVRRAFRELESAGLATTVRDSYHRKRVASVTDCTCAELDSAVIKPAQTGPNRPSKTAQTGPNRPKMRDLRSRNLLFNSQTNETVEEVSRRARARGNKQSALPPPPPQLALLGSSADGSEADFAAFRGRLDQATAEVYADARRTSAGRRVPRAWVGLTRPDERDNLTRWRHCYGDDEIVACIRWSAGEVASGRLHPALFVTTFRGDGFADRFERFERATRALAAPQPAPSAPEAASAPSEPPISAERMGELLGTFLRSRPSRDCAQVRSTSSSTSSAAGPAELTARGAPRAVA